MVKRFFAALADVTDLRNRAELALGCISYEETHVETLPARLFRPPESVRKEQAGIVFCPAWLVDHRLYTRLCLGLAAAGYHVLAFDFAGEGRAPGATWTSADTLLTGRFLHYKRNARNVVAALDRLEEEVEGPLGLVGHSRGGYQAATVRDPRVEARVSIQPFNWIVPPAAYFFLPFPKRVHPGTLYISGDLDLLLAPSLLNDLPMYRAADPPKMWVSIVGSEHLLPISDLPSFPRWTRSLILHYAVAWLDYLLKGRKEAVPRLAESRPGISVHIARLHEEGMDICRLFGIDLNGWLPGREKR